MLSARGALAAALFAATAAAAPIDAAVVADATAPRGVRVVVGPKPQECIAWGTYDAAQLFATGWATLTIHTDFNERNDTLASYAAGYLEGYLTAVEMDQFAANTGADQPNSRKLQRFLDGNWAFMSAQVAANTTSEYWHHVGGLMAQVVGLADGQTDAPGTKRALGFTTVYNSIILGG